MYLNNTWLFLLLTCCYSVPVVVRIEADPDPWDPDHFAESRSKAFFYLGTGRGRCIWLCCILLAETGYLQYRKKILKNCGVKKEYKKLYNKITVN